MKIAIIGGGFTGLACALKLSQKNHQVAVFEKEKSLGGLSGTFKLKSWQWSLEKHYHHFFTNDSYIYKLTEELGIKDKIIIPESLTSIYYDGKIYPFNLPSHILSFSPLSPFERLKVSAVTSYLKLLPRSLALSLEKHTSYFWLKKYYGEKAFFTIWEPLLRGKFQEKANTINMTWTWARIKKRTFKLGYFLGGYQPLIDYVAEKIERLGGKIILETSFESKKSSLYDKIIATVPSFVFIQMFPNLPQNYVKQLNSIRHLQALSLIVVTSEKLLKDTYWLNINDRQFPFVGIIQHTNLIDKKYYGGNEVVYIANYLPEKHPYLKMSKEELFKVYLPYLRKINPSFNYQLSIFNFQLFLGKYAQPVFPLNYSKIKPDFATPLQNVLLANMDMVYPWDRGVNYAIELGYKVAEIIHESQL